MNTTISHRLERLLQSERTCLCIIDMQNDFITGSLAIPQARSLIPYIQSLIRVSQHVVFTQDYHPPKHISFASSHKESPFSTMTTITGDKQELWPDHCIADSWGAEIISELIIMRPSPLVFRKGEQQDQDAYSAFISRKHAEQSELAYYLKKQAITDLVFVGLALDFCVAASLEDALFLGFKTHLDLLGTRAIVSDLSLEARLTCLEKRGCTLWNMHA